MKRFLVFVTSCLFLTPLFGQRDLGVQPMRARQRIALVIGNSGYAEARLKNPVNDAQRMSTVLRSLKFEVVEARDVTRRTMEALIATFTTQMSDSDVAVFYFAGHGFQIEQENYLVPIDFTGTSEADLKYSSYAASLIRDKMESSGAKLRLIILDACRNNPFHRTRGGLRGLAPMSAHAAGTLIAFATGDNDTADDNPTENNGLFTKHLAATLTMPGLGLHEIFQRVKEHVYTESAGRQTPFTYDNIIGDYYLGPKGETHAPSLNAAEVGSLTEDAFWNSVKDSNDQKLLEEYLRRYPQGLYRGIAEQKLQHLQAPQNVVEQQFELKISFCKLVGDVLTCKLLATNIGKDRHLSLHQSRFIDDMGQEFRSTNALVGSIDGNWGNDVVNGVPIALTLEFDKIPSHTSKIALLDLALWADKGLFVVHLRDIPISR